jgi:ribosome-associated translation inhibitor RaiA
MMKLSLRYKNVEEREPVEMEVKHHAEKLGKLLKAYDGDLVQLHGACEKDGRKTGYTFSLNLVLPTGTLHATAAAAALRSSCKQAFGELEAQVKKHQQRLRKDYEWKRKRPRERPAA